MEKSVTFQHGTKEITLTVTDSNVWETSSKTLEYFNLKVDAKRNPVSKFYRVIKGKINTGDHEIVTKNGQTFGFKYGVDANSRTKRENIEEAMQELAEKLSKEK